MSEPQTAPDEGWGVSVKGALMLAGGFFGALALILVGMGIFYHFGAKNPYALRPHADPAPEIRTYQRRPDARLPGQLYGPPRLTAEQVQAVDRAIQSLAAKGDAGWAPLGPAPGGPPAVSQGVAPQQAFPLTAGPSANPAAAPATMGQGR